MVHNCLATEPEIKMVNNQGQTLAQTGSTAAEAAKKCFGA